MGAQHTALGNAGHSYRVEEVRRELVRSVHVPVAQLVTVLRLGSPHGTTEHDRLEVGGALSTPRNAYR